VCTRGFIRASSDGPSTSPLDKATMPDRDQHRDWISVGEFANSASAQVASERLTIESIPHRVMPSAFMRDPTCWIWMPPESADKAKELLSHDAVPEDELDKLALSYPPPEDAGDLN
jgi:hypothetical protein